MNEKQIDTALHAMGTLLSIGTQVLRYDIVPTKEMERDLRDAMSALWREKSRVGYFEISSVHRDDLEGEGYDVSNVDDGTMEQLASKMGNAYTDNVFWIDLGIIAEGLEIPKKSKKNKKNLFAIKNMSVFPSQDYYNDS